MFIINPYRFAGGGIDSNAQAFLTAAGITDPDIVDAINGLVVGLKADGLWSKIQALYPMVGGTASTHKWNLKDPRDLDAAFRLTWNGSWTHSATGAKPDGSTAWADTYFVPSSRQSAFNGHCSYYSRNHYGSPNVPIGAYALHTDGNALLFQINANPSGNSIISSLTTESAAFTGVTDVAAFFIGSRTANNSVIAYRNGINCGSNTGTASDRRPTIAVALGARRARTTSSGPLSVDLWSPLECAGASMGAGLTPTESANFYTRMQAFNTALSRQV